MGEFTSFKFDGFKNINLIECCSNIMLDYLHLLEFDGEVKSYFQPQVMSILIEYARMEVSADVHLWVNYRNGMVFLVRLQDELETNEPADSLAITGACSQFYWQSNAYYMHYSVTNLELGEKIPNINFLWNYAKLDFSYKCLKIVNEFFVFNRLVTIENLKDHINELGYDPVIVYTLLFHRFLDCEIQLHPINDQTTLFRTEKLEKQIGSKILNEKIPYVNIDVF